MKRAGGSKRLWIFDFDGTLSSLVPERSSATLHPSCRKVLEELAAGPRERVAILSNREIGDLIPRLPVPGIFLGGGSGLEWLLPGGLRVSTGRAAEARLAERREELAPLFESLRSVPGVDLEDKRWAVAVHTRRVPPEARGDLTARLERLRGHTGLRMFEGPESIEVQLMGPATKLHGIRWLCRRLKFDPPEGGIVYAGDDESDAEAMEWVLSRKGIALVVGDRIEVPGARTFEDPAGLAAAVRGIAGLPSPRQGKRERKAAAG